MKISTDSRHPFSLFLSFHLLAGASSLNVGRLDDTILFREISRLSRSQHEASPRRAPETTPISHGDVQDVDVLRGTAVPSGRRRRLLTSIFLPIVSTLASCDATMATDDPPTAVAALKETTIISGTVNLPIDAGLPKTTDSPPSALYITCRPDKPDNVPLAILNGSRGKAPPVLAARFENPTFPFVFDLVSPTNLTPEGASLSSSPLPSGSSDGPPSSTLSIPTDASQFWWSADDLIVSARWDSDGVAATRSPEDLVGRGLWHHKLDDVDRGSGSKTVEIILTGRGAFGKLVTGGSKK